MKTRENHATSTKFADFPLADADACVKCALCLPHCPTYSLSREEGDSPRGRIALMQGLARGQLEEQGRIAEHLDGCLTCRACEAVCPAQVPYGKLIDATRAAMPASRRHPLLLRMVSWFRQSPGRIGLLSALLLGARRTGLAALGSLVPGLQRHASIARHAAAPLRPGIYEPASEIRGTVALHLGCLGRSLDVATLKDSIQVLNAMGFCVVIPAEQGCCGALDQHAGEQARAVRLAGDMQQVFGKPEFEAIISTASGCGLQLQEQLAGAPVMDVMTFISQHGELLPALLPLAGVEKVLVHRPCTLKNGMRETGSLALLEAIPELSVRMLEHAHCCGAAGDHALTHPQDADRLGRSLLASLPTDARVIASSNFGCGLHLDRLAGQPLEIVHPVSLLARALPVPTSHSQETASTV
ncbi:MAG: (Fe-S)-binding protein [Gammaproteobacteria bacterium]|nr:(Fe-S)-binding protein [Gammaproteobacteria bacterium]